MSVRMMTEAMRPKDVRTHCPLCGRSFARFQKNEEHIFPRWLQREYHLWNEKLGIPNFIGKRYKSVKIDICERCNNRTFGALEGRLAPLLTADMPYEAARDVSDLDLASWLGKIFWLLIRKSHSTIDFRTRDDAVPDTIIPEEFFQGTLYLGMFMRAIAMRKGMVSCFEGDPPLSLFYGQSFSLYRARIDVRDKNHQQFDFIDSPTGLGVAIRLKNLGLICVFDGGLHREFRSHRFQYIDEQVMHPVQFGETVAHVFHDSTVLDERALGFTPFWNVPLKSVVAMNSSTRWYDPYLAKNHDPHRLATFVARIGSQDPSSVLDEAGNLYTTLFTADGSFFRYPATEEEKAAIRQDPRWRTIATDERWRTRPSGPGS